LVSIDQIEKKKERKKKREEEKLRCSRAHTFRLKWLLLFVFGLSVAASLLDF